MIGGSKRIESEDQLHARLCNFDFGGIDCCAFSV
jgi:hypothetical protein